MDVRKPPFLRGELNEGGPMHGMTAISVSKSSQDLHWHHHGVDPSPSQEKKQANILLLVQIYVDDIIFASTNPQSLQIICIEIELNFQDFDYWDQMSFFLGLQVSQNPKGIFINQSKYAQEILKKFGFDSCTPIDTPMAERPNLDEDKGGKLIDPT
ncbi:retrovirus-related pol polyprotein from transposon TNT 1-94 [Tanacetum coccineum]